MRPEEITPAWLGEVLGLPVLDTTCERVGTGLMAMNFRYRLTLDGDAPEGAPDQRGGQAPGRRRDEPGHRVQPGLLRA